MNAAVETRTWHCVFGCVSPIECSTIAERFDHCIDDHLDELTAASPETIALIVSPR